MKQYSTFHFSGYSWNHHAGKISLRYSLDNEIDFEEQIRLPEPISDEHLKAHAWEIEHALMALHMIGGISYYKTCLPKTIVVHSEDLQLTKDEATFWDTVYEHGLGEFFYRNSIDFRGLIKFPSDKTRKETRLFQEKHRVNAMRAQYAAKPISEQRVLVPIGGGKDSMVTIDLLKKAGAKVTLLRMGSHPIVTELAERAGLPLIEVKRTLSYNLFDLNKEGALNGHVPITAYLSVLSVLLAILYDFDAVVMSNERSANIGNVQYKGMEINHQWSKSVEFERSFRNFIAESIGSDVQYFSLLRPLSELKITELFCARTSYLDAATSCNKNWKIATLTETPLPEGEGYAGPWCCECPKCAFVFAMYAAFLEADVVRRIFGKNLFEDPALLPLYKELLGIENVKPFECVGTPEETKAAFLLARKKPGFAKTAIMDMFEKDVLPTITHPESLITQCLKPNKDHCIPQEYLPLVS